MKRTFDLILSFLGLIVAAPVVLLIAIAIKLDSKGPVIFSQTRLGKGYLPFKLYKFRTMEADAEHDGVPLLCSENDSRMTRVGKFLRAYHLDEIPNLWNVFKGDMSFVGYRPERPFFVDKIMEHDISYLRLFKMRPGIFSEATLHNGYTDTMEKMLVRLKMDIAYLEHNNVFIDIGIIVRTIFSILIGKKI